LKIRKPVNSICLLFASSFPIGISSVVTFARWEEGLVIAAGNPMSVRKVEDLARKNVRFVNRELGSGSRALVDKLLAKAGPGRAQGLWV
jgi:molybdate-binding protein